MCIYFTHLYYQTAEKTQQHSLNRTDAIFEVYTDCIVKKTKSCDKGLLWIISQEISEFSVCAHKCRAYVTTGTVLG